MRCRAMREPDRCPNCESYNTETVHTSHHGHTVEHVTVCHECPTQWTIEYGEPVVSEVVEHE